jgi:hypothetical protein
VTLITKKASFPSGYYTYRCLPKQVGINEKHYLAAANGKIFLCHSSHKHDGTPNHSLK